MKERVDKPGQRGLRKWLPSPPLTAALFLLWLLLNRSASPGNVVLGAALAVIGPVAGAALRPLQASPRLCLAIVQLAASVVFDVIRSNFAVARIILRRRHQRLVSGFVEVPLTLRDPHAIATLACIVTITPGTVWAGLNHDTGTLILHVLDVRDPQEWVRFIQGRYERPLKEIFE